MIRTAWDATFATGGGERAQRVMEGEALVRDAAGISFLARDPWGCYWPVQLLDHFALRRNSTTSASDIPEAWSVDLY